MALLKPQNHRSGKNHIKSSISPLWPKGGSAVTELFLTAAHPSCSQRQPPEMEIFQLPEIIPSHPAVEPGAYLPLQEARVLPGGLWRALEKGRRKVHSSRAVLQSYVSLQHHSRAQHPFSPFPDLFCLPPNVMVCCSPSAGGTVTWSGSLRPSALGKTEQFPWPVANGTGGVVDWGTGGAWCPGEGRSGWFHWVCCQGKWSFKGTLTHISHQLANSIWSCLGYSRDIVTLNPSLPKTTLHLRFIDSFLKHRTVGASALMKPFQILFTEDAGPCHEATHY